MSMTDPIADFLTRVRNALMARHAQVDVPASRMKEQLARILLEQGYIEGWETVSEAEKGTVRITLKYDPAGAPVIKGLERVSKPGRRVYFRSKALPQVLNGLGTAIVSTSHGIMTDAAARSRNVGGEVLCNVW